MKNISGILCILLCAAGLLHADSINVRKGSGAMTLPGKVAGYNDAELEIVFKAGARERQYHITQIAAVQYDAIPSFSMAEKLRNKKKPEYPAVVAAYDKALKNVTKRWEKLLIEHRRYMVLDDAGKLDKAVDYWLNMLDRSGGSEKVIALMPQKLKASSPGVRRVALRKLSGDAKKLERNPTKNAKPLLSVYRLQIAILETIGEKDAIAAIKKKMERVAGVKPVANGGNGGNGNQNNNGGGGAQPKTRLPIKIEGLRQVAEKSPATVIDNFTLMVPAWKKLQLYAKALLQLARAHENLYKKTGGKDAAHLHRAGLVYMLTFFEPDCRGTDASIEALYRAAEINSKLGHAAAARAALKLATEYEWTKSEWAKKAKARLKEMK